MPNALNNPPPRLVRGFSIENIVQNLLKRAYLLAHKPPAPLCKGSCRANARLRDCLNKSLFFYNPSVIFLRKCHLPLHKGGLILVPLDRVYVTSAWLAGQHTTHLCVASSIRTMPEGRRILPTMPRFTPWRDTAPVRRRILT